MLSPSIFLSGVWLQAAPALVPEILHQIKLSDRSTMRRLARCDTEHRSIL
jgi:hypothetical protein